MKMLQLRSLDKIQTNIMRLKSKDFQYLAKIMEAIWNIESDVFRLISSLGEI